MYKRFLKYFFILIICFVCVFTIVGCDGSTIDNLGSADGDLSMFVVVEKSSTFDVVYHRDTKVMYVVSSSMYNCGNFTVLVDENGNPLLWEGA